MDCGVEESSLSRVCRSEAAADADAIYRRCRSWSSSWFMVHGSVILAFGFWLGIMKDPKTCLDPKDTKPSVVQKIQKPFGSKIKIKSPRKQFGSKRYENLLDIRRYNMYVCRSMYEVLEEHTGIFKKTPRG